jgi:hypothetical protein
MAEQPILNPVPEAPPPIPSTQVDYNVVGAAVADIAKTTSGLKDASTLGQYERTQIYAEDSFQEALNSTMDKLDQQNAGIDAQKVGQFSRDLAKMDLKSSQTKVDTATLMAMKENIFRKWAAEYPRLAPDFIKASKASGLSDSGVSYQTQAMVDVFNKNYTGASPAFADAKTRWDALVKQGEEYGIVPEDPRFQTPDEFVAHVIKVGRGKEAAKVSTDQNTVEAMTDQQNSRAAEKEIDRSLQEGDEYYSALFATPLRDVARVITDPQLLAGQPPDYATTASAKVKQKLESSIVAEVARLSQPYIDRGVVVPTAVIEAKVRGKAKPYLDAATFYTPQQYAANIDLLIKTTAYSADRSIITPQGAAYLARTVQAAQGGIMPGAAADRSKAATGIMDLATKQYSQFVITEAMAANGQDTTTSSATVDAETGQFRDPGNVVHETIKHADGTDAASKRQAGYTKLVTEAIPQMYSNVMQTEDPVGQRNAVFRAFATVKALAPIYASGQNIPDRRVSKGLFAILATDQAWDVIQKSGLQQQEVRAIKEDIPVVAQYEINALATSARRALKEARAVRMSTTHPSTPVDQAMTNFSMAAGGVGGSTSPVNQQSADTGGAGKIYMMMTRQGEVAFNAADQKDPKAVKEAADLTAAYSGEFTNLTKVLSRFFDGTPDQFLQAITHQPGFPPDFREPVITTEETRINGVSQGVTGGGH